MQLAAIVDHRGRSATAIETSVFLCGFGNPRIARMKIPISRSELAPRLSFAPPLFPATRKQSRETKGTIDSQY